MCLNVGIHCRQLGSVYLTRSVAVVFMSRKQSILLTIHP